MTMLRMWTSVSSATHNITTEQKPYPNPLWIRNYNENAYHVFLEKNERMDTHHKAGICSKYNMQKPRLCFNTNVS